MTLTWPLHRSSRPHRPSENVARARPARPRAAVSGSAIAFGVALAFGCGETLDDLPGGGGDGADFTSIYESEDFQTCSGCHAPGAPGRTEGIEATQNWSTRATALSSLRGNASGLIGNFEACNGVPLLGSSADQSLLVASLDSDVRASFSDPDNPDCNGDAISDQTLKIGGPVAGDVLQDLKDWIDAGAPSN